MGAEQPDQLDRPDRPVQLEQLAHLVQWGLRGRRVRLVQRGLLALEAESLILQGLMILLLVLALLFNQ